MTKRKNILVVSLVAMLAAGVAHAENASVTYVNTQDQKLADRIKTQDTRIGTIRDWVNPLKDGSRATLATEAQDAYRAINELKEAVDNVPAQVNADWTETDTTNPAYIQNKPENLVNQDALDTALAGKMDKMTVDSAPKPDSTNLVTSGGVKAAIEAAQLDGEVDLTGYATETYVDEKVAAVPAQVNADWNEAETTSKAYIANKPTNLVTTDVLGEGFDSENTVAAALESKADTTDIVTPVQSDWNATDADSLAYIANKPTNLVTTDVLGEGFDTTNTVAAALESKADTEDIPTQVQSDWDVTDETSPAFIVHKPTIPNVEGLVDSETLTEALAGKQDTIDSEHKLPASNVDGLAPVATSGDYADLANTPTIPTQVQSNWAETDTTAPAFIQNKPEIYTKSEVDTKVEGIVSGDMSEALTAYVKKSDVEDSLSSSSTNPVQNLVVTGALGEKVPLGNVPTSGEYVLGFVDGVQTYIPVVDGAGNSGEPVVAIATEPGGGE